MKIAILGASGFSREVADICFALGYEKVVFIDYIAQQREYFGIPLFSEESIDSFVKKDYDFIIGVGDNNLRKKIYEKFPTLHYINLIHTSASFGRGQLERINSKVGNIITAGVRFTNNINIGNFGIYNLNATIGHDTILDDYVNIAPGVNISGNVHISEGAFIGTNASIIQGKSIDNKLCIGQYSTIGAGTVIVRKIPANVIVIPVLHSVIPKDS